MAEYGFDENTGRTSYWGAWIEIAIIKDHSSTKGVAPRIGVRGLKCSQQEHS